MEVDTMMPDDEIVEETEEGDEEGDELV